MRVEQEIEEAIRRGVEPLFLVGLLTLAQQVGVRAVIFMINEAGRKVYWEGEHEELG